MLRLEKLIKQAQAAKRENTHRDEFRDLDPVLNQWREERRQIRLELKTVFNKQFGSVFRTHHNPSYFANKVYFCSRLPWIFTLETRALIVCHLSFADSQVR